MKYIKQEKLNQIKLNKNNMYIVIDFDKTITNSNCEDSWDATGKKLGTDFKMKLNNSYKKYRPIELDYKISYEEKYNAMNNWYKDCMNLYFEYNLTKDILEESVKESNLEFREGAKDFLRKMKENNVPVIIISAGIGNTIELFLKENNCLYDNLTIISNFIKFDENGNMKEFEEEMIHTLNKNIKHELPKEVQKQINNRRNSVLIGDTIEDINMIPREQLNNSITVNFLNENIEENLNKSRETFDVVLTNNDADFKSIQGLL